MDIEEKTVTYIRKKRVGDRVYVYEVAKVRSRRGEWTEQIVRYIGPEDPRYGGRGPVVAAEEREKLARRTEALRNRGAAT